MKAGGFDAVVSQLFLGVVYGALSRRQAPGPVQVALFQNVEYEVIKHTSPVRRLRKAWHLNLLRRRFDGYAAVSDTVARHYGELLGARTKIVTLYNSFAIDKLVPDSALDRLALRAALGLTETDFVLVAAARLVHQKGHRYLLAALEELARRRNCPHLLVLGQGPLESELKADVAQRGLQAQVSFLGAVAHERVVQLVQAADIFVMPSTHEGLPLAAAEAMALQCPVLASRISSIEELIEDGVSGLLATPADPAALAAGIERLQNDGALRTALGRGGRQRVAARFDANLIAAQWETLLQSLVEMRTRQRAPHAHDNELAKRQTP
jgi:glycosyltransferase involved in cell wall biosynthesis